MNTTDAYRKGEEIAGFILELLEEHFRIEPHHHHLCALCQKVKVTIGERAFTGVELQSLVKLRASFPPSGDAA
jgi:hypothetical protein